MHCARTTNPCLSSLLGIFLSHTEATLRRFCFLIRGAGLRTFELPLFVFLFVWFFLTFVFVLCRRRVVVLLLCGSLPLVKRVDGFFPQEEEPHQQENTH